MILESENLRFLKTQGDEALDYKDSPSKKSSNAMVQNNSIVDQKDQKNENSSNNPNKLVDFLGKVPKKRYNNTFISQTENDIKQNSISYLMGEKSPEQFAREFVYGNQSVLSQNNKNKRQNTSQIINKIGRSSFNKQNSNLSQNQQLTIDRLSSPNCKQRTFGSEISHVLNSTNVNKLMFTSNFENQHIQSVPSSYTQYSEKVKENFKQKEECRAFPAPLETEIILNVTKFVSPTKQKSEKKVSNKSQQIHNEYLATEGQILSNKKQMLADKYLEIEKQKCPFKPAINKFEDFSHNKQSFLDHQELLLLKYQDKKQILEQKLIERENEFIQEKPTITEKSKQLASAKYEKLGLETKKVVERLYTSPRKDENNIPSNKKITSNQSFVSETDLACTFSPKISKFAQQIQRDKKVDILLYEDAMKKIQDKHKAIEQKEVFLSQQATQKTFNRQQNALTVRAAINRFHKEYQLILGEVLRNKCEEIRLNYSEFVDVLRLMNFIDQGHITKSAQQSQQVWHQLGGKVKGFILQRNLLIFLYAVQNIYIEKDLIQMNTKYLQTSIDDGGDSSARSGRLQQLVQGNLLLESDKIAQVLRQDEQDMSQLHKQSLNSEQKQQNQQPAVNTQDTRQWQYQQQQQNKTIEQRIINLDNQIKESNNTNLNLEKVKRIGYFDTYLNLHLTEQDVIDIHHKFYVLYNNKLVRDKGNGLHRKISKSPEARIEKHSFSPTISLTSSIIAQEKKQRLISIIQESESQQGNSENHNIDFHTISCFQKSQYEQEKINLRKEHQEQQLSQCTFHPVTIDFSTISKNLVKRNIEHEFDGVENKKINGSKQKIRKKIENLTILNNPKSLGNKRNIELYNLARPIMQRKDRTKLDIEYEKECDECTFSPDIVFNNQKKNDKLSKVQIKDIQKSVERTKQGQIQNQIINNLKEQGSTFNKKKLEQASQLAISQISLKQAKSPDRKPKIFKNNKKNKDYSRQILTTNSENHDLRQDSARSDNNEVPIYQQNLVGSDQLQQNINNIYNYIYGQNQPQQNNQAQINYDNNKFIKVAQEERVPLLFVDVNIEDGKTSRIVVYEGDKSEILANKFANEHGLDSSMKTKLKDLLDQQINSLLTKIEEEIASEVSSQKEDE